MNSQNQKKILLLLLVVPHLLLAQTTGKEYNFVDSPKIVKANLGTLFSRVPALGMEVESFVNDSLSLHFGMSLVPSYFQPAVGNGTGGFNNFNQFNNGFNFPQSTIDILRGYGFNVGGRVYPFKRASRYVAADVSFRHIMIRSKNAQVGMEPLQIENGWTEFAYFQSIDMRFHQFRTDLSLQCGIQQNFGKFVLDVSAGIRLRTTNVNSRTEIPNEGILQPFNNSGLILIDGYKQSTLLPMLSFKFGYQL